MGMFDDIKCEFPLPLPQKQGELAGRNWRENGFQTKDLDCLMEAYCIREDGTLLQQTYAWETTRKGRLCRKPVGWQPLSNYTGTVRFYDSINGSKADYWVEWVAAFVTGKLTDLKLERWEERDNRQRLASEAQWEKERLARERFLNTWMGKRVYPAYAWVIHGCFSVVLFKFFRSLSDACDRVGWMSCRLGDWLAPHGDPIGAKQRWRRMRVLFDWDESD